jgi:hypothetical protein
MVDFGILLVGLGAVIMGIYHVARRRYVAIDEIGSVIGTYRGAAVVCQGLSEAFAGVGVLALGLVRVLGQNVAAADWLTRRPWPILVCGSVAALFFGCFMMLGSREQRQSRMWFMMSIPGRLLGLLLVVLALAGLVLGLLDLVAPTQFDRGVGTVRALLPRDFPEGRQR